MFTLRLFYIPWSKVAHYNAHFWDFRVLGECKLLMSILNWQVSYSSNLASLIIVRAHSSPVNFKRIHFLLWIKGFHQNPNFKDFRVHWRKFAKFLMSFFKIKNPFFFKFLHQYSVVSNITHTLSFSSSTMLYQYSANFWDFWMLRSKFVKLLRSVLNSQVSPSSNFLQMFFFSVMKDTPLKGTFPALGFSTLSKRIPSKSTFWEFECSGQKFPNSYCHFWKHNSVFF